MTKSFQEASGWSRVALGLQNWQRIPQLGKQPKAEASIAGDENWFLSLAALRSRETWASAYAFVAPLSFLAARAGLAASAAGSPTPISAAAKPAFAANSQPDEQFAEVAGSALRSLTPNRGSFESAGVLEPSATA